MKLTILLSLLPFLISAAPTEPQAAQIGPAVSYPFRPDSSAIELSHSYEKRFYKETYYVDLYNRNYMWVLIQHDKNGTAAMTTRWEHRAMLTSGGPSYSSAAPSASPSAVRSSSKSVSSSVGTPRSSSASSKSSSASTAKPVSSSAKSSSSSSNSKPVSSSASKASSSASKPSASVSGSKSSLSASVSKTSSSASKSSASAPVSKASSSASKSTSSSASKSSSSASSIKPSSSSASPRPSSSSSASKSSSASVTKSASSSASKASSTSSAAASSASTGVSAADQTKFLTIHNDFRAKYSAGPLVWDSTLAEFALKTAQTCKYGHTGGPNGENIAAGVGGGYNIDKAFGSWANEDALYDFSKPGYTSGTGHFTQIVWKGTSRVGCAAASCADSTIFTGYGANSTYVVCEYQTPGNIVSSDPARTAQIFTANVGPKAA